MFRAFLLLGIISIFGVKSYAQNFSISGVVKDHIGTLPGAGIYISGYKIATASDADGKFKLANLKPGSYEILVQMMGYLPFSKSIIISDKSVEVTFLLKESTTTLNEVVIKVDPNRQKYINQFKEYFIGKTPNSKQCKILNPNVLRVHYDITRSTLSVETDEFLIVENKALGYRIKYMLDFFEYNSRTNIIYYSGKPFFEEMKASAAKRKKYIELREIAYYGSAQHFFKSLYKGKTKEEGFVIKKIIQIPNPNRAADTLINKTILAIKNPPAKSIIQKNPPKIDTAALAFWIKQQRMPKTIDQFNNVEVNPDTLVNLYNKDLKYLNYTDALCIMYTKERETTEYTNSGMWILRPLYIPDYQLSVAELTGGPIRFYENGGILDSRSLLYKGFWAYEKAADMVPMDYIPLTKKM